MSLRIFSWVLYAVVGAFFAIAATVKIVDPEAFLSSLLTYQVFPQGLATVLALFAPVLELLVAICLITGILRKGATLLTVAMLALFIALVAQGMVRGLEMDCGCFGSNSLQTTADYALKIGQNIMLLGAMFVARFLEDKK
ncbi:DoxX subfamily, putative [Verrucomicrobiia bacterium DG1235]|nr:DoxX subfamily, putative [Verrucomicrobiae bacterium DG1235]